MKNQKTILYISLILLACCFSTGCRRNSNMVWEDTKSAGRHVGRGLRSLGGKHGDSRQVRSRDEFISSRRIGGYSASGEEEFIPLSDDPNEGEAMMADVVNRPPRESPGEMGSSLPGIEAFQDPSRHPQWGGIFHTIYFAYNSSLIKGQDNLETLQNIANYMRRHPHLYIFVEGHCDERGPEAYNLVLGSYRANSVRNILISEGVSPDNIFTISYGRERPVIVGHDEESWGQNRRAEFKVYER
jgi:peptidoglycan-associated lipoprotein